MNRGQHLFLSDLHLFTQRSSAEDYQQEIFAKVRSAETVVLGGDIFDFNWSRHATHQASLDAAQTWLEQLVTHNRQAKIYYLLGNHDDHPCFTKRLQALAEQHAHFRWDPHFVRLKDSIFLHGDVVQKKRMTHEKLASYRAKYQQAGSKSELQHLGYRLVVSARVHLLASRLFNPKKRVAKRLLHYLDYVGHGPAAGIKHVYYGHTHLPLSNYEYRQVKFYNGGAPIKGNRFQIVEATI